MSLRISVASPCTSQPSSPRGMQAGWELLLPTEDQLDAMSMLMVVAAREATTDLHFEDVFADWTGQEKQEEDEQAEESRLEAPPDAPANLNATCTSITAVCTASEEDETTDLSVLDVMTLLNLGQ